MGLLFGGEIFSSWTEQKKIKRPRRMGKNPNPVYCCEEEMEEYYDNERFQVCHYCGTHYIWRPITEKDRLIFLPGMYDWFEFKQDLSPKFKNNDKKEDFITVYHEGLHWPGLLSWLF